MLPVEGPLLGPNMNTIMFSGAPWTSTVFPTVPWNPYWGAALAAEQAPGTFPGPSKNLEERKMELSISLQFYHHHSSPDVLWQIQDLQKGLPGA